MRKLSVIVIILLTVSLVSAQEIEEYEIPSVRPHDVAPAPDGSVWYTGQGSGEMGRLDPETGEVTLVPLGEGSRPHGVIVGPEGDAWVTDGGLNAIVRVDAETQEVSTYSLPEGTGYANLNTATFDGSGVLWFTGQSGIYGSFNPATEEMQVFDAPRGAGPYGITTTPLGRGVLRLLSRFLRRAHRHRDGRGDGARAPHPQPGRAPRLVGLTGAHLGGRVERGAGGGLRPRRRHLARVAAAWGQPGGVRGVCRRARRGLADRLRR